MKHDKRKFTFTTVLLSAFFTTAVWSDITWIKWTSTVIAGLGLLFASLNDAGVLDD